MAKFNAIAAGISSVSLGILAVTQASTHPFSFLPYVIVLAAIGTAVFAGYCLTSGETTSDSRQDAGQRS